MCAEYTSKGKEAHEAPLSMLPIPLHWLLQVRPEHAYSGFKYFPNMKTKGSPPDIVPIVGVVVPML
jgi:hypothetical protein